MSKGNKPPKNDKARMKPKKAVAKATPSKASDDLNLSRLSGVFNTVNKKAGAL